ncbi:MAG: glycosyltransferase [Acutalibacteraceae bacterium]
MKILQVNCVYGTGSTGKITAVLHQGLKEKGIESIVCYGRGASCEGADVFKTCSEAYAKVNNLFSRITGVMYGGCNLSTKKLIKLIEAEKPDVVHLQCINGYFVNIYRLLCYLKTKNIHTVLTLHAEFMYTGGCGYSLSCDRWKNNPGCGDCPIWKTETGSLFFDKTRTMWQKMYDAFCGMDNLTVVSVSPWLMERAKDSSVLCGKKNKVIYNGLDTSVFYKRPVAKNEKKVVFHASPYFNDDPTHIKGGYFVLELAKRMPDVEFVVAGSYNLNGAVPENVKLLGRVNEQSKLAEYYSMADVTLLTSKRETFSMICAESLCCGTPVVGFEAGAPEQISLNDYSEFVEYGDLDKLEKVVEKWLSKDKSAQIEIEAKARYSKDVMTNNYINIYKELVSGENYEG